MASTKTSFVDRVLGRLTRLDTDNVRALMRRLAEERSLLETVFNIGKLGVLALFIVAGFLVGQIEWTRLEPSASRR